jgi:hypothetical protein
MPLRRARANLPANNVAPDSSVAVLAALLVMLQELATLRQDILVAPVGSASAATTQGATIGAIPVIVIPMDTISLMQWTGLQLDSYDGSGSPVEAIDWLTYVEDKMNVFEVVYGDRVCYGTQLLKGEAQIWWRAV